MDNGDTRQKRQKKTEKNIETIMTENITRLMSAIKPQIQKVERTANRIHVLHLQ